MKTTRYATSRQKACQQCSAAKAKCDRKTTGCSRCSQRNISCVYPQVGHSKSQTPSQSELSPQSPESLPDMPTLCSGGRLSTNGGDDEWAHTISRAQPMSEREYVSMNTKTALAHAEHRLNQIPATSEDDGLDFSNLYLFCPINVDEITTRWMNPYIPVLGQQVKQYPAGVSAFIFRTLKSYAGIAARGRGVLPFIHHTQMSVSGSPAGSPLTTCLSLIRICETPSPGSEATAMMMIQREMQNVMESSTGYDDLCLLGAFQAYLIYCLVLFFRLDPGTTAHLRPAMMSLQTLAHLSSKQGLICMTDQQRTRPRWEEWIVTEIKRRTLYVMYLFDSVLSAQEGVPTFLGTELSGLPAAASKLLWQAPTRSIWEREYNIHLAEWTEQGLTIDELWPMPEDMDEPSIAKRRRRVDHWLEDIDEFGTMLYAVTVCTHGG